MTPNTPRPAAAGAETDAPQIASPRLLLRLEAGALLAAAVVFYAHTGASWWLFALLFLAPDIAMLGYLRGPRTGALAYNLAHTYGLPALLGGGALWSGSSLLLAAAVIWLAHIGFDRLMGYGLKHATDFNDTHLGRIGR